MKSTAPIHRLAEHAVQCAEQALESLARLVELLAQLSDEGRETEPACPEERRATPLSGLQLTKQERRVLTLVAAGLPNRRIAELMGISDKTVKNYVHSVLVKLDVNTRTEAASKALSEHLVDPDECRRVRLRSAGAADLVPVPREG